MTNPIGTLALESARVPGFRCLWHSGSLNLGHPTALCLPPQRGSPLPGYRLVMSVRKESSLVSALWLGPVFDLQSRNLVKIDPVACHQCGVELQSDGGNRQVHFSELPKLTTQSQLCLNGEL